MGAPQLAFRSSEFHLELPGWKATVSTHTLHAEAAMLRPTCTIPPLTSSTGVLLTIVGPPLLQRFLVEQRKLGTYYDLYENAVTSHEKEQNPSALQLKNVNRSIRRTRELLFL